MEFNIRAISLGQSVSNGARIDLSSFLSKEIEFRAGISFSLKLPKDLYEFTAIPEPDKVLTALTGWARVYKYPDGASDTIHVIAPVEDEEGKLAFYRVDMIQKSRSHQRPRPPVEIFGGGLVSYDDCATWLINLAEKWGCNKDAARRYNVLQRPRLLGSRRLRMAWVGPEVVDGKSMPDRLRAIGLVYGSDIIHIAPRTYRDVAARLHGLLPLDAVIICRRFAPQITSYDAVPEKVRRDLIHFCNSETENELEQQIKTWAEISILEIEKEQQESTSDQNDFLLAVMLRGMLNHSKIGQFNHCQRETVLSGVKARHLNVPLAEKILSENSEAHYDTKDSDKYLLWKEHGDGRQYFLNPSRIEVCKGIVALHLG